MPEYKGEIIGNYKEDFDNYGGQRQMIGISPQGRDALIRKLKNGCGYLNITVFTTKSGSRLIKIADDGDRALGGEYSQPPQPPQQQAARFSREDARAPEPPEIDPGEDDNIPF